jgi:hypothetical protein
VYERKLRWLGDCNDCRLDKRIRLKDKPRQRQDGCIQKVRNLISHHRRS